MAKEDIKEILLKYRKKIGDHIDETTINDSKEFSQEYNQFREEALGSLKTRYEKWCNASEKLITFSPDLQTTKELEEAIGVTHLNITPQGAASFAAILSFITIIISLLWGLVTYILTDVIAIFFPLLMLVGSIGILKYCAKIPLFLATRWRLKAGSQMVLCILYIVMYMRHTSNLENAIKFAAEHSNEPLSLDLRKIFWDVEVGKYATIKESLDSYLETWRHYNLEFITSFHLIESSLYESNEERREALLDKSLEVILEGSYNKMLRYARDVKGPITALYMLGIILPILGLVLFPLAGTFLGGIVKWYHVFFLYNIILPLFVFGFGMNILAKRPPSFGESELTEKVLTSPYKPTAFCFFLFGLFFIIGFLPIGVHIIDPSFEIQFLGTDFLGFYTEGDNEYGPFGLGAMILGFFIPLGMALAISTYYKWQTKDVIELRKETEDLEKEFSSALFQLGNRVSEGIPTEAAFGKVAESMHGTPTGNFLRIVDSNIRNLGMGIKEALFNEKTGAVYSYPSGLIESSMKVLVESARKGPQVVAKSMIGISLYIERIEKVNERLKDLLTEVTSSMKSQIAFLTPLFAGIVVGISSMIVSVLVGLSTQFSSIAESGGIEGGAAAQIGIVKTLFNIGGLMPTYTFQIVVGIYVVQLAFLLTILYNGIEFSGDKIRGKWLLGRNILRSFMVYLVVALLITVFFTMLAKTIFVKQATF